MWTVFVVVLGAWVLLNVAASYAPLLRADRISPGRIPAELMSRADAMRVRFYVGTNRFSYAYNLWAPPYTAVIFDRHFFSSANPSLVRFVVAHELGHARYNHHIKRWLSVVTGAILLPRVREKLERQEGDADRYAIALTGMSKEMFPQLK